MKSFRVIGSVFIVFGFFFALIGILASLLPMIENEQLKLIIQSFQETSADSLTNTLNAIVRFCLHSSYFLLFCGISLMVTGGLISSTARGKQKEEMLFGETNQQTMPAEGKSGVPRPAYYPGGMTPSVSDFPGETKPAPSYSRGNDPLDLGKSAAQKTIPIAGGIAAAFSSDENDAHKLMVQDRQLASKMLEGQSLGVDTFRYRSNIIAEKEISGANTDSNCTSETANMYTVVPAQRPKIVSTIGKRIRQ